VNPNLDQVAIHEVNRYVRIGRAFDEWVSDVIGSLPRAIVSLLKLIKLGMSSKQILKHLPPTRVSEIQRWYYRWFISRLSVRQ
jgi:hypothetical protein